MEQTEKLTATDALRYLKAGYHLTAIIANRIVHFVFREDLVFVLDGDSFLKLNEYVFRDLYKDSVFEIEESSEEDTVDPEKDREYYSWRQ